MLLRNISKGKKDWTKKNQKWHSKISKEKDNVFLKNETTTTSLINNIEPLIKMYLTSRQRVNSKTNNNSEGLKIYKTEEN